MDHMKPRAAPNVFPMPYHRTVAEVDRDDVKARNYAMAAEKRRFAKALCRDAV